TPFLPQKGRGKGGFASFCYSRVLISLNSSGQLIDLPCLEVWPLFQIKRFGVIIKSPTCFPSRSRNSNSIPLSVIVIDEVFKSLILIFISLSAGIDLIFESIC